MVECGDAIVSERENLPDVTSDLIRSWSDERDTKVRSSSLYCTISRQVQHCCLVALAPAGSSEAETLPEKYMIGGCSWAVHDPTNTCRNWMDGHGI